MHNGAWAFLVCKVLQISNLRCVFPGPLYYFATADQEYANRKKVGRDNVIYPRYSAVLPRWLRQKFILKNKATLSSCEMFPVSFVRCLGRLISLMLKSLLSQRHVDICLGGVESPIRLL